MKVSKDKLQEMLTLYLNDIEDYGTQEELILAESVLSPYKKLLTENHQSTKNLIHEMLNNPKPNSQVVIKDFLIYLKESQ
jgi:hypothetical protein